MRRQVEMSTCLVTGVAGFIGSHLAERLVELGHSVIGVDCFTDFYSRHQKEANLQALLGNPGFRLQALDLASLPEDGLQSSVEYIFHLAAVPGVRTSWGRRFSEYLRNNVLATQRLLEAAGAFKPKKLILASSSSVYGNQEVQPVSEAAETNPASPYGVTKLAAEKLVRAYHEALGIEICILRYFPVYGPRQRPDMAFHRFLKAALLGEEVTVFGDGSQERDFVFVDDVVDATVATMQKGVPGVVANIGSGESRDLRECIDIIQRISGRYLRVRHLDRQAGDVGRMRADISRAQGWLEFFPRTTLQVGLARQWEWIQRAYGGAARRSRR